MAVEQSTEGPLLHPSLEQLQDEQTREDFSSALESQLIVLQPLLKVMTSSLVDSSETRLANLFRNTVVKHPYKTNRVLVFPTKTMLHFSG